MKHRSVLFVLMLAALLQSCSSPEQMTGTYIGSSMGGMLGSAIGGATSGRRGAYTGEAVGMIAGGIIGAVLTSPTSEESTSQPATASVPAPKNINDNVYLKVSNLRYIDAGDNQTLDMGETSRIEMDIHNISDHTIYNIVPNVQCNRRGVLVSSPAVINDMPAKRGVHYTVYVACNKKIRRKDIQFEVTFGNQDDAVVAGHIVVPVAN